MLGGRSTLTTYFQMMKQLSLTLSCSPWPRNGNKLGRMRMTAIVRRVKRKMGRRMRRGVCSGCQIDWSALNNKKAAQKRRMTQDLNLDQVEVKLNLGRVKLSRVHLMIKLTQRVIVTVTVTVTVQTVMTANISWL
jgi:hypothetical protein